MQNSTCTNDEYTGNLWCVHCNNKKHSFQNKVKNYCDFAVCTLSGWAVSVKVLTQCSSRNEESMHSLNLIYKAQVDPHHFITRRTLIQNEVPCNTCRTLHVALPAYHKQDTYMCVSMVIVCEKVTIVLLIWHCYQYVMLHVYTYMYTLQWNRSL